MKILHTSDWHLGHEHYNYNRQDEFEDFFLQLRDIVRREQPDAMLVSGDIYHSSIPIISTQTMYVEAILDIHEACPEMEIIVTAGNHDSASRLEVDRLLWDHFRVRVVGNLVRTPDGVDLDRHVFVIPGKGIVAAVPHVFKQNFPPSTDPSVDRQEAFYHALMQHVEERNTDGLPVVLMAHLAVKDMKDGNSPDEAGGMEFEPLDILGEGYDYAALGHIHHPRFISKESKKARYCGSPLAITFRESYEHSVTIAQVEHGKEPVVDIIPLHLMRPVRTIPDEPVTFEEAIEILKAHDENDASYIQLNVRSNNGLPVDCNERALKAVTGKRCRFCTFHLLDERDNATKLQQIDVTPEEFMEMTPMEVAKRYLESKGLPTDDYLGLLKMTLDTILKEKAQ